MVRQQLLQDRRCQFAPAAPAVGKMAQSNLLHDVHRFALSRTRTGADRCRSAQVPTSLAAAVLTSSIVVDRPSESRIVPSAFSRGMPSASSIADALRCRHGRRTRSKRKHRDKIPEVDDPDARKQDVQRVWQTLRRVSNQGDLRNVLLECPKKWFAAKAICCDAFRVSYSQAYRLLLKPQYRPRFPFRDGARVLGWRRRAGEEFDSRRTYRAPVPFGA